jgi:prophage regulatory protein
MQQKSETIIRLPEVIKQTGLSRSTIYSLIKSGDFPQQIQLSERTMGFTQSSICDWVIGKIEASASKAQS